MCVRCLRTCWCLCCLVKLGELQIYFRDLLSAIRRALSLPFLAAPACHRFPAVTEVRWKDSKVKNAPEYHWNLTNQKHSSQIDIASVRLDHQRSRSQINKLRGCPLIASTLHTNSATKVLTQDGDDPLEVIIVAVPEHQLAVHTHS